ncbi:MAG: hypothetical protein ACM31O_01530 [Bacteroidota bacterium]
MTTTVELKVLAPAQWTLVVAGPKDSVWLQNQSTDKPVHVTLAGSSPAADAAMFVLQPMPLGLIEDFGSLEDGVSIFARPGDNSGEPGLLVVRHDVEAA